MLAGTYMQSSRYDKLSSVVRFINDILLIAPSDRGGLFIYEVMVAPMDISPGTQGRSQLAVIVIPVVVRHPRGHADAGAEPVAPEAAAALGHAARLRDRQGVLPRRQGRHGHRGAAAVCPHQRGDRRRCLFTALKNQFFSTNLNAPVAILPTSSSSSRSRPTRNGSNSPGPGALIITFTVLALSIVARALSASSKQSLNVASVAVPTVNHAPVSTGSACRKKITIRNLNFYYGSSRALKDISLAPLPEQGHRLHRASGCGKSTLLRILNRDVRSLPPTSAQEGDVQFDGEDILSPKQDLNLLRARIGMCFQKPTPFRCRSTKHRLRHSAL